MALLGCGLLGTAAAGAAAFLMLVMVTTAAAFTLFMLVVMAAAAALAFFMIVVMTAAAAFALFMLMVMAAAAAPALFLFVIVVVMMFMIMSATLTFCVMSATFRAGDLCQKFLFQTHAVFHGFYDLFPVKLSNRCCNDRCFFIDLTQHLHCFFCFARFCLISSA